MTYYTVTVRYRPRGADRDETPRQGEVQITLDIEAIKERIARKALRSQGGRATAYGGLIKAKVTHR